MVHPGWCARHRVAGDVEPNEILLDAADSCPSMAITVADGGVQVGPRPIG